MEKDTLPTNSSGNKYSSNQNCSGSGRDRSGVDGFWRLGFDSAKATTSSDFVLQWGNRKRLRCMKVQVRDEAAAPVQRTTVCVDRRVVRADNASVTAANNGNHHGNGHFNLRQRPSSPSAPPPQRILRNSEPSSAMRGQANGGARGIASPDKGGHEKRGGCGGNHNDNNRSAASSETAHDSKRGGSSSGSGDAAALPVWPSKFMIALTNKEKEEDFFAFKGSKLPQRPKKRAKFIQRTLNLVCPGQWLCDLTLERYEVREKKTTKKRPRGLKAMSNMESDSEERGDACG